MCDEATSTFFSFHHYLLRSFIQVMRRVTLRCLLCQQKSYSHYFRSLCRSFLSPPPKKEVSKVIHVSRLAVHEESSKSPKNEADEVVWRKESIHPECGKPPHTYMRNAIRMCPVSRCAKNATHSFLSFPVFLEETNPLFDIAFSEAASLKNTCISPSSSGELRRTLCMHMCNGSTR